MKLVTQLSKGPPYTYHFKMGVSDSDRALIERADAWGHILCPSMFDDIPSISVKSLLTGSSFQTDTLLKIQVMESYVDGASQGLRNLLATLDGFGQPKFRDY
jgi:hypothetical protein